MPHGDRLTASIQLLLDLSDLQQSGRGETTRARELEDESEREWSRLTEGEQSLVRTLSADLWFLAGDTEIMSREPLAAQRTALEEARAGERWEEVARLLHACPAIAKETEGAQLRAELWSALGLPDVAERFYALLDRYQPGERLATAARNIDTRRQALAAPFRPRRVNSPLLLKPRNAA
jgi:hypothetical protein